MPARFTKKAKKALKGQLLVLVAATTNSAAMTMVMHAMADADTLL